MSPGPELTSNFPRSNLCKWQQVYWKIPNYLYNFICIFQEFKEVCKNLSKEQVRNKKKIRLRFIGFIWCNFHQDPLLIPLALFWLLIVNLHLQIEATFKKFDQTGNDKLNLREFGEMMNKRSDQSRKKSETSKREESQSEGSSTKSWSFDKFQTIMCSPLHIQLSPQWHFITSPSCPSHINLLLKVQFTNSYPESFDIHASDLFWITLFKKVSCLGVVVLCSEEYLPRSLCGLFQSVLWENASLQHFYTIREDTAESKKVHEEKQKVVGMLIRGFVISFFQFSHLHKCLHYLRYCRPDLYRSRKIFLRAIFAEEVEKYHLFIRDEAAKLFLTAWHFLWCR